MTLLRDVLITGTAAALPGAPVDNADMERILGQIGPRPSRARAVVLRSNGIQSRHYVLDPSTGEPTMTNAQLAAQAIRALGEIGPVDTLAVATSSPDQLLPGHGVMVHAELGWPSLEIASLSGVCVCGMVALKHAWMAVRTGESLRAVSCASETASVNLRASRFHDTAPEPGAEQIVARPELAFEKNLLRWTLSDGAAALLLEPADAVGAANAAGAAHAAGAAGVADSVDAARAQSSSTRHEARPALRIDWIDLFSQAHRLPVCMWAGAGRDEAGNHVPWAWRTPQQAVLQDAMCLHQDVRLLDEHIVQATLAEPLRQVRERRSLRVQDIDWFLPHVSSMYFAPRVQQALDEVGLPVPRERWFLNLQTVGNTGSASALLMLDELRRSGRLRRGERILLFVPESGRFSSAFVQLTVV